MIKELISRAKYIKATRGLLALIGHAGAYALNYVFRFEVYGIWVHFPRDVAKLDAEKFLPRVSDLEFFIVENSADADQLEDRGYEFRSRVFRAGEALKNGGIALIAFVHKDIASITWIARNARLQKIFDDPLRKIGFEAGEALICGAGTFRSYRKKGLYTYTLFKTLEYLGQKGNRECMSFTARRLPIFRISERLFGSKLIGYGYWLRILGIQFFREKAV